MSMSIISDQRGLHDKLAKKKLESAADLGLKTTIFSGFGLNIWLCYQCQVSADIKNLNLTSPAIIFNLIRLKGKIIMYLHVHLDV